jgi:hypothetical protein
MLFLVLLDDFKFWMQRFLYKIVEKSPTEHLMIDATVTSIHVLGLIQKFPENLLAFEQSPCHGSMMSMG